MKIQNRYRPIEESQALTTRVVVPADYHQGPDFSTVGVDYQRGVGVSFSDSSLLNILVFPAGAGTMRSRV